MDVMKTASIKLRRKAMATSSRLPVQRECKDLKASWHLVEAGHTSTSWSCGDQVEMAGFPVWASKMGARLVRSDGGNGGHVASSRSLR
jgi:hypothetical protein